MRDCASDWADLKKGQIIFLEVNNIMIAIINLIDSFNSRLDVVEGIIRLMQTVLKKLSGMKHRETEMENWSRQETEERLGTGRSAFWAGRGGRVGQKQRYRDNAREAPHPCLH